MTHSNGTNNLMWIKRLLVALAFAGFAFAPVQQAWGQFAPRIYLGTGALLSENTGDVAPRFDSNLAGTAPAIQGGVKLDYAKYMRVRAGVMYQELLSFEGGLEVHPLGTEARISPYAYAGYGRYFGAKVQNEEGVFPLGLGVEYGLRENLGLKVEVVGRWTEVQPNLDENPRDVTSEIASSFMPMVGITYKLNRIERRPPSAPVEEESAAAEEARQRRRARESGNSPFEDPLAGYDGEDAASIPTWTPPSRDSLRNAEPIVITGPRSAPLPDPGGPSFTGDVESTQDGTMVKLPDGTFLMGLTDEDPYDFQNAGRRRITVSAFYFDRYEVTNAEYRDYVNSLSGSAADEALPDSTVFSGVIRFEDYFYGSSYDTHPVVGVTWYQAKSYCQYQGKKLPTEAEWEYAARAGYIGAIYPWNGLSPTNQYGQYLANFSPSRGQAADGHAFTSPVDDFPYSKWGIYAVSGNAAEWVADSYSPSYNSLSASNPFYQDSEETEAVVRGGSWDSGSFEIGVGVRASYPKDEASDTIGFRCAANVGQIEGGGRRQQRRQQPQEPVGQDDGMTQEQPPAGEDSQAPEDDTMGGEGEEGTEGGQGGGDQG